jgi:polysaccharide biosynthesis protein PslA
LAKPPPIVYYALGDFIAASVSWIIIYYLFIKFYGQAFDFGLKYFLELILYSFGWLMLYHLFGAYKNIYYKSRINEMMYTFVFHFYSI